MGEYNRNAETNAITITPDPNSQETWLSSLNDQNIWATSDDYSNGENPSETFSNSSFDGGRQAQSRSAIDQPPNKKPRLTQGDSQAASVVGGNATTSRSRAIGKMFFKTKLCCKFRAGTCPYITNCNFAHGIDELRKPPPNWQEIVASQDDGSGVSEFKEEPQNAIPIVLSSSNIAGEVQRSYKGRHCKKFYTDEGCPYGDVCTFMHDEQSKSRESVAINLGPTTGIGPAAYGNEAAAGLMSQKPSNWKTRICNKWEMTGYCPFGSKCHFAHGAAGNLLVVVVFEFMCCFQNQNVILFSNYHIFHCCHNRTPQVWWGSCGDGL